MKLVVPRHSTRTLPSQQSSPRLTHSSWWNSTIERVTERLRISRANVGSVSSARRSSFFKLYHVRPGVHHHHDPIRSNDHDCMCSGARACVFEWVPFSKALNESFQFFLAKLREMPPLIRKPTFLTSSVISPLLNHISAGYTITNDDDNATTSVSPPTRIVHAINPAISTCQS